MSEVLLQAERALREGLPLPEGCEHLIARAIRQYVAAGPSERYTFTRVGDGWLLDDGTEHYRFWRSRVGFERLHQLLRSGELHVATLVGDTVPVADARALREVAARLAESTDADECEQLRDYLRSAQGKRRIRPFVDEAERTRQAVAKSIKAAIEEISEVLPEMGEHLRGAVRTGTRCTYESRQRWHL